MHNADMRVYSTLFPFHYTFWRCFNLTSLINFLPWFFYFAHSSIFLCIQFSKSYQCSFALFGSANKLAKRWDFNWSFLFERLLRRTHWDTFSTIKSKQAWDWSRSCCASVWHSATFLNRKVEGFEYHYLLSSLTPILRRYNCKLPLCIALP